ncbi:MAG: hypothetical protein NC923_01905 [Candidatus Omnitrophica bacterium]|nr:hypothetical protein [Candidatus Omnitrophota bacterium]
MKKHMLWLLSRTFIILACLLIIDLFWYLKALERQNKILLSVLAKERELEFLLTRNNNILKAKLDFYMVKELAEKVEKKAADKEQLTKVAAKTKKTVSGGNRGYLIKNGFATVSR